ncbi:Wzz/FepE/Etk N-terminal domain-containing protein [Escherichia coli]|uniref:Wzz/FepE/Etk N-terminal domain-containing protein n=1 Tax=Escherichia coli TaxID=562 RepID=UPI001FF2D6BE|nr:Wzz/FepE/Etk N-terminal domain-containing protein [Escherichia coli]MCJ8633812.1 Wzz/FepE/Etk N-terminal domain-containing protein [Escherichia coli]MCP8743806.1 Wzz/FepE/Etk N-terminal domain-containing protein [Escherichia coli]MCU6443136.1 Wzz/FepE/Etk N-terminal domain-containing protein [Escherichia coli]MCU6464947.1 Wzz/FepE/Etk N-terminal domain-containing protein [Escherichia coli]MCU6473734.1 Wzz/FepE/Etk N-terminal domain-containing protein [Escherichia coli]
MNTTKTSSAASDEIDLLALFKILKSSYLKIGFFTLFFIVIGAAYSFLATPIYQANATLQYDKMGDVMPFANNIEAIKSQMVLGKTVADLNLDTHTAPAGFSIGFGETKLLSLFPSILYLNILLVNPLS